MQATAFRRISKSHIDLAARALRARLATELADKFLGDWDRSRAEAVVARSLFRDHVLDLPVGDPLVVLAFNLHITEHAIDYLLLSSNEPCEIAFTASRVAELGGYSLADPRKPSAEPRSHLGASKQSGYFFTPPETSLLIADRALSDNGPLVVLDPSAGCGALLAAVMVRAAERNIELTRIVGIELDEFTAGLCTQILAKIASLTSTTARVLVKCADAVEILADQLTSDSDQRYDCIVLNPPYGRAKFLKSSLTNGETRVSTRVRTLEVQASERNSAATAKANRFRAISTKLGLGAGAQDHQRIFIGLSLAALSDRGRLVVISPSSWLGDNDSAKLRKMIMVEKLLEEVILFPEDSRLFATVNQPTAVAVFDRVGSRSDFSIGRRATDGSIGNDGYKISYESIERLDPTRMRVPRMQATSYDVYERLAAHPRFGQLANVRNARGELDLTIDGDFVVAQETSLRLIRGDHIERYVLREPSLTKRNGYVDEERFRARFAGPKAADVYRPRVVGRQVSYLGKGRRLSFSLVPAGVVLGNSCNYVVTGGGSSDAADVLLKAVLVLLNSLVAEWFFRVFNSNNHVANYEIAELPVCFGDVEFVRLLSKQADFLTAAYSHSQMGGKLALAIEDTADALIGYGFGLSGDQLLRIATEVDPRRAMRVAAMLDFFRDRGLPQGIGEGEGWYQHSPPRLSALDRDMIRYVPQGGNWQNIPDSVPSQRLAQIREMTSWRGVVRTTYYGRLRPDQPAYTIATYYNRPGNGTNIHPWEDRTLSSREAARLQSFPDSYVFLGTAAAVRNQIGNAVPPLLSYAVGRQLSEATVVPSCVDLYAGAGGLSLGLEMAGWRVLAAIDHDKQCADTYQFNRACETKPKARSDKTLFVLADLMERSQRERAFGLLHDKLGGERLGAIVGGPPCQGFSHAGWRSHKDERNNLAGIFMTFVEELRPNIVVLENVEGLLTFGQGSVIRDLVSTLRELGYNVGQGPWVLRAERYGVPQMRRRIFLVGSRQGELTAPQPVFATCAGRRENPDTPPLLNELPYPMTAAEALASLPPLETRTRSELGKRPLRTAYRDWVLGRITVDEFLTATSDST